MSLALAALALIAAQDVNVDMPPPRPIPSELAAPFAGAIRRHSAFAAGTGRTVESPTQGFVMPRAIYPSWVVEFHWREKSVLHPGVAFVADVPAARRLTGSGKSIADASLEGPWGVIAVFEDKTLAAWSEDLAQHRRETNESMTVEALRSIIHGALPDPTSVAADMHGYRRTFHPGARTWAYSAVPMDPKFGRRAFCGDSTGLVCAVAGATMPPIVDGSCPKRCQPLP